MAMRFLKQQWEWCNEPWSEIDYRAAMALLFAMLFMFSGCAVSQRHSFYGSDEHPHARRILARPGCVAAR